MTTYTAHLDFDKLKFRVNLAEAASPIQIEGEDGWIDTQYQCADARHDMRQALALVLRAMGPDYFRDPTDERDNDEIVQDLVISAEISKN